MIPPSIAALTNARKPGFSALIFSDVKTPTSNSTDYKPAAAEDLDRMDLMARTQGIFYGPATGRDSERTTTAVFAEANDDANRFLRMVFGGRPLSGSVMQAAENIGASRCAAAACTLPPSSSRSMAMHMRSLRLSKRSPSSTSRKAYIPCANSPCFPLTRESATPLLPAPAAPPPQSRARGTPGSSSTRGPSHRPCLCEAIKRQREHSGRFPTTRLFTQHLYLPCALELDAPRDCAAPRARRAAPPHRRRQAARAPTHPAAPQGGLRLRLQRAGLGLWRLWVGLGI